MAHIAFRAEKSTLSSLDATRQSDFASESERRFQSSDDPFDYPPTAYPGRELFTFSLFVLAIVTFTVWGGWKLISLL